MKPKFYVTKEINESLDIRLVIQVQTLITTIQIEEVDYLQIFEIEDDTLTHRQEIPEYKKEYRLNKSYKDEKLFCIRTDEPEQSYWTLMYAREY